MPWRTCNGVHLVCAAFCLASVALGGGCRKSATELAEKASEEREELLEAQWHFERAGARARNLYHQGKEMQRQSRYKEAVALWAEAIKVDEEVTLIVDLAKNLMADEMIKTAHYRMHRPYENRTFTKSSREILNLIVDEKSDFLEKHVKKAREEIREWEWITGGWKKFARAQRLIDTHQLAEGLDLLEAICKDYPRTPLADKTILLLKQYGR